MFKIAYGSFLAAVTSGFCSIARFVEPLQDVGAIATDIFAVAGALFVASLAAGMMRRP